MSSSSSSPSPSSAYPSFWLPQHHDPNDNRNQLLLLLSQMDCLCLGTGRFLRSVLVPALVAAGFKPGLIPTRGRSFLEFMLQQSQQSQGHANQYPVDTVQRDGSVQTDWVPCFGAFSIGTAVDKKTFYDECLPHMLPCRVIGIGVTEAGLASADTQAMKDLYELLCHMQQLYSSGTWKFTNTSDKICIVNTDNVPNNGTVLRTYMMTLALAAGDNATMQSFLQTRVAFINSMVDRIVSQRDGSDGLIPRAEPIPAKALVLLDTEQALPPSLYALQNEKQPSSLGVVIRTQPAALQMDVTLKLRVANGTHTALAHVMALLGITHTNALAQQDLLLHYVESLFQFQILPAAILSALDNDNSSHTNEGKDTAKEAAARSEVMAVWEDWKNRLTHEQFGLSTFFITQNGAAKGGIRIGPTVLDLLLLQPQEQQQQQQVPVSVATAFCFAVLFRWLTPMAPLSKTTSPSNNSSNKQAWRKGPIYMGRLATVPKKDSDKDDSSSSNKQSSKGETVLYADGMHYNLQEGWYEFKCDCHVSLPTNHHHHSPETAAVRVKKSVSEWLAQVTTKSSPHAAQHQPTAFCNVIRAYLLSPTGGNLALAASDNPTALETLVHAIATLYARMVAGDDLLQLLQEMILQQGPYETAGLATDCRVLVDHPSFMIENGIRPLHYRPSPIPNDSALMQLPVSVETLLAVVLSEVSSMAVIDLHTHLLPPSHGPTLCLWGPDELLTYHYLVAEFFMTAPATLTPEDFYQNMSKQEQADCIWQALFVDRIPLSEACRGVLTTWNALGLSDAVQKRDLQAIRKFFRSYRERGLAGAEEYNDLIFKKAGVKYCIMTNIPFDPNEAQHWPPQQQQQSTTRKPSSSTALLYRSAVRVDPLLAGDRATIEAALKGSGYDLTLEGARQYLRDWIDIMKPEYVMASTPHNFVLKEGTLANVPQTSVNRDALLEPGAFAAAVATTNSLCNGTEDEAPSLIDENSDYLTKVLLHVCQERDLPLALKIGSHRGINPRLKLAGDGVVAFADAGVLSRLCAAYPKVRFLATFLSRNNQHEACVLASKFRNLHLYGCWWYCNNPSIVREMTQMRLEMLGGTSFTAQHSDARVLDQLLYKWPHARAVIADVLQHELVKLCCCQGWVLTRAEIRRDIGRLLGGSYEDFKAKSLL